MNLQSINNWCECTNLCTPFYVSLKGCFGVWGMQITCLQEPDENQWSLMDHLEVPTIINWICLCYHNGGGGLHCWWMEQVEYSMSIVASSELTLRHVDLTMMWHVKIWFVWLTYCLFIFLINSSINLGSWGDINDHIWSIQSKFIHSSNGVALET